MTELVLVRHAQPHGGVPDPSLTPAGHRLAERAARWLAHDRVDVVLASPLVRACETAQHIADAVGCPVITVEGLREWDAVPPRPFYMPLEDMDPQHPATLSLAEGRYPDFVPPFDQERFVTEAARTLNEIFERWPVPRIVAVAHGGIINAMLSAVVQPRESFFFVYPAYASFSIVERVATGRTVLRAINDTGHLLGERDAGSRRPDALDG